MTNDVFEGLNRGTRVVTGRKGWEVSDKRVLLVSSGKFCSQSSSVRRRDSRNHVE